MNQTCSFTSFLIDTCDILEEAFPVQEVITLKNFIFEDDHVENMQPNRV